MTTTVSIPLDRVGTERSTYWPTAWRKLSRLADLPNPVNWEHPGEPVVEDPDTPVPSSGCGSHYKFCAPTVPDQY